MQFELSIDEMVEHGWDEEVSRCMCRHGATKRCLSFERAFAFFCSCAFGALAK